jgi:hypothetical protein
LGIFFVKGFIEPQPSFNIRRSDKLACEAWVLANIAEGIKAAHRDATAVSTRPDSAEPAYRLISWLSLIGVLLPSRELSMQVGVNLMPGRICVILMFLPALARLLGGKFRMGWPDVFALGTAGWIVVATVSANGAEGLLTAAGAESLEFFGAYMVGRAFLSGASALRGLLHVLRIITVILLAFALADRLSGQWIIHDTFARLVQVAPLGANYREGVVRATASLDHPILLGAFFSLATGLFIFSNESPLRRFPYVAAALLGCFLSLSSASVMAWSMTVGAFVYDRLLRSIPWRWGVFWAATLALLGVGCMVANAPLGWILSNLTWDPQSAYFRYLIWEEALDKIALSPIVGYDFAKFGNAIIDTTVDCVWLAYALRFGLPMIVFLFLTNLTAIWPLTKAAGDDDDFLFLSSMSMGYTVVLVMFMFIGLTVHFWNYMWIFWGLCIGTKVSIKETLAPGA